MYKCVVKVAERGGVNHGELAEETQRNLNLDTGCVCSQKPWKIWLLSTSLPHRLCCLVTPTKTLCPSHSDTLMASQRSPIVSAFVPLYLPISSNWHTPHSFPFHPLPSDLWTQVKWHLLQMFILEQSGLPCITALFWLILLSALFPRYKFWRGGLRENGGIYVMWLVFSYYLSHGAGTGYNACGLKEWTCQLPGGVKPGFQGREFRQLKWKPSPSTFTWVTRFLSQPGSSRRPEFKLLPWNYNPRHGFVVCVCLFELENLPMFIHLESLPNVTTWDC